MARQKRIHIPGGIYHVITRGINRSAIFKDQDDCNDFLNRLEKALSRTQSKCHAWALMRNHLHLLLRTSDHSLSDIMKILLTGYATHFNGRYRRRGYVFQNRFKSILCQEETYFIELVRYIHLNPVRAGIVSTSEELDHYPWTGHATIVGTRKAAWQSKDEVLIRFGGARRKAVAAYRQYLADGWSMGKQERLSGGGLKRSMEGWQRATGTGRHHEFWRGEECILGDEAFVKTSIKRAEEELERKERQKRAGWTLERLAEKVCVMMGVREYELIRKGRNNNLSFAKGLIAYWGKTELGQSGAEIARFLHISRAGFGKAFRVGERVAHSRGLKWTS